MRISCLINCKEMISYEKYLEDINAAEIYKQEENEILRKRVFILSVFPEFLLDYFGAKLWRSCVKYIDDYKMC